MSDFGVKNRWIARKEKLLKRVKDSSINGAVFHSFIHSFTHSLTQSINHACSCSCSCSYSYKTSCQTATKHNDIIRPKY